MYFLVNALVIALVVADNACNDADKKTINGQPFPGYLWHCSKDALLTPKKLIPKCLEKGCALTDKCAQCFGDFGQCGLSCVAQCLRKPSDPACKACMDKNNCDTVWLSTSEVRLRSKFVSLRLDRRTLISRLELEISLHVLGTRLVVLLCFLILIALSIYLTTPTAAKVGAITRPLTEAGGFSLGMEDQQPLTSWDPVLTSLKGVSDLTSLYGLQTHENPDAVAEGFQYARFTLSPPTLLEESTAPGKRRCSAEMRRVYVGLARQAGLSQSGAVTQRCGPGPPTTSEVRATVFTLSEALGDPGLTKRLAEGRVARIEVLVGLLTGGHGSESSVVSVLRFEWKRASNTDPTVLGEISFEHGMWVIVSSLTLALSIIGTLRDIYKIVRSVRLIRCHETELLPREAEAAQGASDNQKKRHGSVLEFVLVFSQPDDKLSYPRLRRLEGHHTHARLLDLRDSLRRETYSASFGMLLMWVFGYWTSSMPQPEGITFATIFVFMSLIGHYAAGEDFEHFRTVWSTLVLQFEILWSGEWDIPNWSSHPALSLYLITFVVVIFIALLNFFVAIVVEAYLAVRRTVFTADYTHSFIQDYMAVMSTRLLFRWRRYPHRMELVQALAPLFAKQYVDVDDLEQTGLFSSDTDGQLKTFSNGDNLRRLRAGQAHPRGTPKPTRDSLSSAFVARPLNAK
ncbi:hypothetical protein FOZ62_003300 [Perkinsus olseni]|uniref:TRP-like ion channel Pkd2 n=1 Tax=Perkinsus olseni TaxID=32597 RepID=A0A7J6PSZ1_PEROL|nr:hypothetical protein FOZ62_003300 [Perkinsus olseni]